MRQTPPNTQLAVTFIALLLASPSNASAQSAAEAKRLREAMVEAEVAAAGIENERVLRSLRETPRHEFVPLKQRKLAYLDMALPIGEQQTISPPFVVAYMTEQLDPQPSDKVLEIGTGSGYQAAVLSPLVREVYSIEIVAPLGRRAARTLKRLKYKNVETRIGDGYLGWPEAAPFDKIIVTCSPDKVPQPLVDQLHEGGQMIVPVGERYRQNLYRFTKVDGKLERETLRATFFVPMTGEAEEQRTTQPDPLRPSLTNGGFESVIGDDDLPEGWHYLRQVELVTGDGMSDAPPEGSRYLRFRNDEPGRASRALQGFPVDGRKISELAIAFHVKGEGIRFGQTRKQWPLVVVTYYDDRRAAIDEAIVGPFQGSFDWTRKKAKLPVPLRARDAIIRIGLLGAIGEISFDDLQVSAAN
ncbi:MAG: protein-L-isoaspartate(D-aspartate) O-methyltransferase [Planctomycetota bacterium]